MAIRNSHIRQTPEDWSEWIQSLSLLLDSRTSWRLPIVLLGLLLARGRRTVTSWLRAQGIGTDYEDYYYFLSSLGRKTEILSGQILRLLLSRLPIGERIVLALDDTPTKRYGPKVEGAGLHHNPTSGPDDHKFIYGHIWVTLAWVVRHPLWQSIALPLRALMYVKRKDFPRLAGRCRWTFQTKLQMAERLITWAVQQLKHLGKPLWIVFDGAYAYRPLLREILPLGITVVSRLRKDAALRDLPPPRRPGQKGGKRKYGLNKISLAKRAAHRQGWSRIELQLYGRKKMVKTYKTFLATWPVVGGVIRVVIVREADRWESIFCTDPNASVAQILECFADRSAIEQAFHDLKEVWGTGQQQVRNLFTNVACYHLNLWMHTLVELWAWDKSDRQVCDRTASPWDQLPRRPSHADKRNALRRACFDLELLAVQCKHQIPQQIRKLLKVMTSLTG